MLLVGITGGIGSGKSTVCRIFEVLGVPVYYADDRAKYLMHHNASLVDGLKRAFGEDIYKDGELDRPLLAAKVFNDKQKLEQLNGLVHPAVAEDSLAWQMQQDGKPYTLREAALLFETGSYKTLHKIIVVAAPLELRLQRVMQRDSTSREQVLARIANQWPEEEKLKLADYIIHNDGQHELIGQVIGIHNQLLSLYGEMG